MRQLANSEIMSALTHSRRWEDRTIERDTETQKHRERHTEWMREREKTAAWSQCNYDQNIKIKPLKLLAIASPSSFVQAFNCQQSVPVVGKCLSGLTDSNSWTSSLGIESCWRQLYWRMFEHFSPFICHLKRRDKHFNRKPSLTRLFIGQLLSIGTIKTEDALNTNWK